MLEKREFEQNEFLGRLATAIAVVSGFFSVLIFVLLVINYLQVRSADPVDNEMLTLMRQQYAALPEQDEALAARIQQLDLLNRKAFFTSQEHLRVGGMLLLIAVVLFMTSFKYALRWRRDKPELEEEPTAEREFLAFAESRQLISWAGVVLLGLGLGATLLTESALSSAGNVTIPPDERAVAEAVTEQAKPAVAIPAWDEVERHWPAFRGPGSDGIARYTNAPMDWNVESGEGIRWKTEIPLPGYNSPVVWGNRIFLSGATAEEHVIYCLDTDSGTIAWEKNVGRLEGSPAEAPEVMEDTGHAAPSLVVHGELLFAIFANGDLVAYDFEGNQVWGKSLGVPENHYGHSSSLIAYDDLLFVQYDQKKDAKLLALDIVTGQERWMKPRTTISWSSPMLAKTVVGTQLILNNEAHVEAYAPLTGDLVWSQECLGGEVAPSPAYAAGRVFVANEYAVATAIELGGTEEAVESKIAWQYEDYLPEVSSPVGDGERFYFGTSMGDFVCLDAKTGEERWVEEVSYGFYSSPILVADKLYILDNDGKMYIIKAGPEYELLKTIEMGERTFATPAYLDGRIYLRTESALLCIEKQDA